ncbi:hypothetical protein S245_018239 [Arachis hypogaea]|uniref:RING-type E3 ubiquitin transferase n=1 Tax=Arachis hypogaea TaxID=3818 RepID=A0A445CZ94_ARAHY|nr:hypothetical protein Ahy_A05g022005 isoform A [Arachis hypogaea]
MAQPHPNHLTWIHLHLILLFLLHGSHSVVHAQGSMEPVPTDISHHSWQPSFAITIGAIICAFLFMGIITVYLRNCTGSHINNRNQTNQTSSECSCSCSQGITKELLNTFPILFYPTIKDLKIGKASLECAICLTDFKDYDTLRLLPKCDHVFHPQCIDSWLCSHVTCPVCRANLNQDTCEIAITVPTQLSTPQSGEESLGLEAENNGGEEHNAVEQNHVEKNEVLNSNDGGGGGGEGDGGSDGVVSKPKLLKSNSTGHTVVDQVKSEERYTLRLPEDVRRYILVNHGETVQRSSSYNNNNGNNVVRGVCWSEIEESSGGGKRSNNGEVKVERWVLCSRG